MHELSIAQSVIRSVLEEMERRRLSSVKKIHLRIGPWSGVMADAVQFNFTVLCVDTPLRDVRLIIEEPPPQGQCTQCSHTFPIQAMSLVCPQCGCESVRLQGGDELEIAFLETGE
ncbi:MAG TPA: hydrogenase maturation nickel metallochaperone HypA [bacterium]|nr:hydrogenase maturation nickel metallochaperone HypA [bacterium]HPN33350.1 hydrogenase maturation nickel metallochaperone HypA [bacterium]